MASSKDTHSVQLKSIGKYFGTRTLFEDLTLQIGAKSRIGLIGKNGCGKSTLLKIIMDKIEPEEGEIYRSPGVRVNYLSQEPLINPELTLEEELRTVFARANQLNEDEAKLIEKLEAGGIDEDETMALMAKLEKIHQEMDDLGIDTIEARISKMIKGLGFSPEDHHRKTGEFSGGWQMRINLAKVLLDETHVLLLDEPTNHLDLEACEWLENFLKDYPGGIIIVSHDREFLDQVITETAELENGGLTLWRGNYSQYLTQKAEALENMTAAYERQQKELEKQTAFVDKFRASATRSTQAKSREKQLNKIERLEPPKQEKRKMAMSFPPPEPSGKEVLALKKVSKTFEDKLIFKDISGHLNREKRVFLLGANGCGKTTLLKLIMGLESSDSGSIESGHNVSLGYFSQNQLETLDPELSVFDTLQEQCPKLTNTELRTILGCFLFTGEQVFKPVKVLSGGEKSKLALAKLMMSGTNTMLLDEPTNHMDIPSKEVITEALQGFKGTMLCISHDRYFIQQLATEIWEIYNGQLLTYGGGYDYYKTKRDEIRKTFASKKHKATALEDKKTDTPKQKTSEELQNRKVIEKELKKLEKLIIKSETEITKLNTQSQIHTEKNEHDKLQLVFKKIGEKQKELDTLNKQWESLAENLA